MSTSFFSISLGGKIGITITHFASNKGPGPRMPWEKPGGYPAINGYTFYEDVTFSGFQETCGKRHRAIMTNNWIGDIFHPVDARGLSEWLTFASRYCINLLKTNEITKKTENSSSSFDNQKDAKTKSCDVFLLVLFLQKYL